MCPTFKATHYKNKLNEIYEDERISHLTKRALELACEKGVSTWFQTNPSKKHGFVLNKQSFVMPFACAMDGK